MGCSLLVRLSEFSQAANDRTNLTQRDFLEKIGPGTTLLHGYSNAPSSSIHLKKIFLNKITSYQQGRHCTKNKIFH